MKKSFFFIIIACTMWGTSGLFVNFLAPYGFSSLQMTAVRGTVSFILLAVVALIRKRSYFKVKPKQLFLYFLIGLFLFLTAYCYYSAMQMLNSVSTAVVLMYASPIYVLLFSIAFLGEKLSLWKAVSVGGMLVGCVLVSGVIGGGVFQLEGILVAVASGLTLAGYNIVTKICLMHNCEAGSATLYGFLFMSLISLCVSKPLEIGTIAATDPALLIPALIALGVVTYVVPYFLYTFSLTDIPAGTASALGILEPMSATLFSVILLHEELTVLPLIGILLIMASVILLGFQTGKE